jgi:hypothetical protein
MGIAKVTARSKSVNDDLLAVLPDNRPWYTKAHLIKLHFCIASLILFCKLPPQDSRLVVR